MTSPDMILSLGPNCRNTWNIRNYFHTDRAYPFDWWITPARSMLAMLDPAFAFHVERDDLIITDVENNNNSVYNRKLNLLHHHDFNRENGVVTKITDDQIDNLNGKYRMLFKRLWLDLENHERPLAIINGICSNCGSNLLDKSIDGGLNKFIEPQDLIDQIRLRIGDKIQVLIVSAGEGGTTRYRGGAFIQIPDDGTRQGLPPGQAYAEPVHVFHKAYSEFGLTPQSLNLSESADRDQIAISNNTPHVWRKG